ncbi:HAMP domain-containing sensor histidine kinase [Microbulbifer sp. MLAF003]|uniref:sensor histidine kinase n=1 Tax=unclassified Microbulbifer TaxID=2619833 RepID=UPI0024ACA8F3|nr:HAMP domain-containing sensor histidine kinase [Microbulbifer sp. MLAF003]WHI52345.1 HAMP domain-containing sensor histidine kinase [Microbulbifer sp. MLAF003]
MMPLLRDAFYRRLILLLLCSFIVVGVFFLLLMGCVVAAYQSEVAQNLHRDLARHLAEQNALFVDGQPDKEGLYHLFHDLMVLGPNFEFYLLSPEGEVLAYSAEPAKIKRQFIDLDPIRVFLDRSTGIQRTIYGPDPRDSERLKVFSAAPVERDGQLLGYMYVIIGSELFDDVVQGVWQNHLLRWVAAVFLGCLILSLIASLWVFALLTRPLRKLTRDMQHFRAAGLQGDLPSTSWNTEENDLVQRLGSAFNELSTSLKQQYQSIKTIDEMRRELLTHISHDLRTPLSSLQGYLETWLIRREELNPDDSRHYVETAYRSSKKVNRLVEQLFELACLESADVPMKIERVVLAELIQDVLQKFTIKALEQGVHAAVIPQDSSIVVYGDIEKLERVFSNLVENALRHCGSGDEIIVQLRPHGDQVSVSVKDSGMGIPVDDLPNIFDAHYRAANSKKSSRGLGGLGLAITKRLLALHRADIYVRSRENFGTAFEFQLHRRWGAPCGHMEESDY